MKNNIKYTADESKTYLSKIEFVPNFKYTGKTFISYVAFDEEGAYTIGTIQIIIK